MLDSSPVSLPPVPRPLKRSASVASLPTPPRTRHKHRSSSRYSESHSSGSETEPDDGDDAQILLCRSQALQHKKRRTAEKSAPDDDEEAFWLDSGPAPSLSKLKPKSGPKLKLDPVARATAKEHESATAASSLPSSKTQPLVYRRGTTGVAPVSPPPSHRKATAPLTPKVLPLRFGSPPVTPRGRTTRARARSRPLRDSPNNPFLVSPSADNIPGSSPLVSRTPPKERPTVTYVFRGVRGTFPNPLYDHKNDRPLSPSSHSRLPPEHPDFSPSSHCTPKLLFPEARRGKKGKGKAPLKEEGVGAEGEHALERERARNLRRARGKGVEGSTTVGGCSDDEDGDGDGSAARKTDGDRPTVVPMKLNFGASELKETSATKKKP